jgi:eukaryotic-like serine/threonine-protein kinase
MSGLTSEILFEKFQVIEVLKKDEHAAVFLANHIYLSKKIILKVLNTEKIYDPSFVERFKREAKILAKLDHPNIIKVLDFGLSKEFFYISFEYIEGESLREVFKTKTLTYEQKEHIMIQLLKGLDYAHKNQIIHRDIKPENIFIDKNLNVKLGDFGLALSAEDNFVTNPYAIVGTPSYMSPEQVRGAKLTPQSDLFSVGVVLFELFTGRNPFLKENVSLTLNEINSFEENTLKDKIIESQAVNSILIKLLKKNMTQRYNSAEEVLEELNVMVDQPSIVVSRVDREGRQSKLAWMLILVIVLVVAGIIFYPKEKNQTQNEPIVNQNQNTPAQNTSAQLQNPSVQQPKETVKNDLNNNNANTQAQSNQKPVEEAVQKKTDLNTANNNNNIGTGWLDIKTYPRNAEVFINGESIGRTPFNFRIPEKAGEYTVKFAHPNYGVFYKIVKVTADEITQVNVNIESETSAFIYCQASPQQVGDIYINDNLMASLPLKANEFMRVAPGAVNLVIKNPRFKNIDTSFVVHAKDTLRLRLRFKAQ